MALAYESMVPASYRTAFIEKVKVISARLGIKPDWLMIVMRFESAGTFSPSVKNPNANAYGLIQFTQVGISGLGVTLDQLRNMDAITQLDYVEKYLKPYVGKMTDVYQVYMAVFAPAYVGRPDAQKVYGSPSVQYTANKALDTNNDGVITIGEIKQVISRYIPAGTDTGQTVTQAYGPILGAIIIGFILFKIS